MTDLEALAADTHDFESRYLDRLVGPLPEAARHLPGPIAHPPRRSGGRARCSSSRGPTTRWCPLDQAERFAAELRDERVPCRLVVFEGESHGFRRAATIEASLEAELGFYRSCSRPRRRPDPPRADRVAGRPEWPVRSRVVPVVPSTVLTDRLRMHRGAVVGGGWAGTPAAVRRSCDPAGAVPEGGTPSSTACRRPSPGSPAFAVGIPLYRQWGQMAVGPYASATLMAVVAGGSPPGRADRRSGPAARLAPRPPDRPAPDHRRRGWRAARLVAFPSSCSGPPSSRWPWR